MITLNSEKKPVIVHSVGIWLPLTMTWVHNQLKYIKAFFPVVFAQATQNLKQFPWDPIYLHSRKSNHLLARGLRKLQVLSKYPVFDDIIKKHHPNILHSHFGDGGWYDLPLARKYRLKHVVTFYGYDVNMLPTQHPVWKQRYKELFERADLFLCEGPHMAKCLAKIGCPVEKLKVQRIGVEVDKILFVPRKLGEDGLVKILIASTFREKKGIPYALEAVGILKKDYPKIRITLIGDATTEKRDQEEKKKIMDIIERYDLEPITRIMGFQPYNVLLKEAYNHHIFLSPSVTADDGDTEGGSPVTITEMAASGMPIVSTWHCDIPEVVLNNQTGFLVSERNVQELSLALEKLINSPESWVDFGIASRAHMENKFNIANSIKYLEEYYNSLM